MSSYTFEIFLVEKYGSSALKCRIGRLHTMSDKLFMFKSKIYMKKPQNLSESNISGYPARLSTSYIYIQAFEATRRFLETLKIAGDS